MRTCGGRGRTPCHVRLARARERQTSMVHAPATTSDNDTEAWVSTHGPALEDAFSDAVSVATGCHDPISMIAQHLLRCAADEPYTATLTAGSSRPPSSRASSSGPRPSASVTPDSWSACNWVRSLRVDHVLEDALLRPLGDECTPSDALAFVRRLGRLDDSTSSALMREMLVKGGVLDALADELCRGANALANAAAASGAELHAKFLTDGSAFQYSFGSLEQYFGGLEALIGPPSPKLDAELKAEHCNAVDSTVELFAAATSMCMSPAPPASEPRERTEPGHAFVFSSLGPMLVCSLAPALDAAFSPR
jgi:hypothetical protein